MAIVIKKTLLASEQDRPDVAMAREEWIAKRQPRMRREGHRRIFDTWVENQLAPTLSKGDVVILDNLSAHKSQAAEQAIRAKGAWLLFLPPYSPDLNPIEMAFSKLKAHLRARAVRTIDDLWRAIGDICELFDPDECSNFFKAAGYAYA